MGAIVLLVIVLCGFLASRVYIKRQRQKLLEERERKLKIAEGIFDEAPHKPAPKRKKRRWGWMQSHTPPPVPAFLQGELINKAPVLVERMLQRRHACLAARAALKVAERTYRIAEATAEKMALPARLDRANLEAWAAQVKATCLAVRQTGRAFRERDREFATAEAAFTRSRRTVDQRLGSFDVYDCGELSAEATGILEISRVALDECRGELSSSLNVQPPAYFAQPDSVDPDLLLLCDRLSSAVDEMLSAAAAAYVSQSEAELEFAQLSDLARGPALDEPQKPTEEDVQSFLTPVFDWAARSQAQEKSAHSKLPGLESALKNLEVQVAGVRELLSQLREQQDRKEDASPSLPLPPPPVVEASPAADPKPASSAEAAPPPRPAPGWHMQKWDLDEDYESPPPRRKLSAGTASIKKLEVASLTDEQESMVEAAGFTMGKCDVVARNIRSAIERWSRRRPAQEFKPGPPSEAEQATLASVNAALRKLGFAVAQRNSANAKLMAVRAAGPCLVSLVEPSLSESNAEGFVRSHHKWRADAAANLSTQKDHGQRISVQQQQYDERARQVAPTVSALGPLMVAAATSERSRELDAAVRVAQHLRQVFTASTPAPVTPARTSSSSSSSARKSRARRKR